MTTNTDAPANAWLERARAKLDDADFGARVEQIGRVEEVEDGVALISGLPEVGLDELLRFDKGQFGFAQALERERIGCVLLDDVDTVEAGDVVRGTGNVVRVPVGPGLLGRIVDPLGRPIDGRGTIEAVSREPIERPAPGILERDLVTEPVQTGLVVIDALFALGRGQRELIIGDRAIGKTTIAIDTIISQRSSDIVCVYVAVGQKTSSVRRAIAAIQAHGEPGRCIVVVAGAASSPGLQWIAPFAGFTMAEYFRDRGRHALIVIDDLTKHAAAHREIALLTRQSPGREAYPGDVFYVHARLLERAAKLSRERGGGSLTALPIAETDAGNLSAYIPTNLISIADGQIVLDAQTLQRGAQAGGGRRRQRQPGRRQDSSARAQRSGRAAPPRLRAIHRARDVHALRRHARRPGARPADARRAHPRDPRSAAPRAAAARRRSGAGPRGPVRSVGCASAFGGRRVSAGPARRARPFMPGCRAPDRADRRARRSERAGLARNAARLRFAVRRERASAPACEQAMTKRLADVSARIEGIRQLGAVVNAMRGIASARAQQARSQLVAVESYATTIAFAIGRVLALAPSVGQDGARKPTRPALVLFCAEQGFAGAFSERVLDAVSGELATSVVFLVGSRGRAVAAERGVAAHWSSAMPAQSLGVSRLADRIAEAIYVRIGAGGVDRLDAVFSQWRPAEGVQIVRRRLFPFDLKAFAHPTPGGAPLRNLPPEDLLRDLTADYMHAQLCDAALHAFAAENEARVEAMASAHREIDRQLAALRATQRLVRQEDITAEIIELAAGETASRAIGRASAM